LLELLEGWSGTDEQAGYFTVTRDRTQGVFLS